MAKDLLERLGEYRQVRLDTLSDDHVQRLSRTLQRLESEVVAVASQLPTRGGKLFQTRLAIELRPKLKQLIEEYYLTPVALTINDYDEIAGNIVATYGKLPVPEVFKQITEVDLTTIQQLKKFTYTQFEDLGNELVTTLSDELYQSTLTGRSTAEMITTLKGKINGIYQSSDNAEAQELVDFIANNPEKTEQVNTAVSRLQTIYGSDRLGDNFQRYAGQLVQDSIMGFDGQFAKYRADELGLTSYKYTGTTVRDSRDFCRRNVGMVFTTEEIDKIWSGSWTGKSSGNPFVVRGGYNCRHHWQPLNPDWVDAEGNYKLD